MKRNNNDIDMYTHIVLIVLCLTIMYALDSLQALM
jgi:hypothetical protein